MKKNIIFIPGGPGLSADSFKSLEALSNDYKLHFFNPMGTGGGMHFETPTYDNLLTELRSFIQLIPGEIYLCGHSFGGVQAIDLASNGLERVAGIILIGAPVSDETFATFSENVAAATGEKETKFLEDFNAEPTNEKYKEWFNIFKDLYFNPTHADKMVAVINDDRVNVKNYLNGFSGIMGKAPALENLKTKDIKKLFISGELDKIVPPMSADREAKKGGFELQVIPEAGHFVHFERPEMTAELIRNFIQ